MSRVLSALSSSFLASLQKNIENQLFESHLFGANTKLVSQTPTSSNFPFCNLKLFTNVLNSDNQLTLRLHREPSNSIGIFAQLPEVCNHGYNAVDALYVSFLIANNDADVKIHEVHQTSKLWWKKFINRPLNLHQKIQPKCYEILYDPSPNMKDETAFVIEKTWMEAVSIDENLTVDLICNIRSTMSCMNTFLHDSVASVDGYDYLKLHHKLAPIQTSIIVDPNMENDVHKILDELLTIFQRENIRFDFSDCSPVDLICRENDLKGIPFSIILCDNTVTDGILGVRDRNTHFVEPMNFKNVIQYMKLNLHFQK